MDFVFNDTLHYGDGDDSQFYPAEGPAGGQLLQAGVRDERAVVELEDGEAGPGRRGACQLLDPAICDQLAVRQRQRLKTQAGFHFGILVQLY